MNKSCLSLFFTGATIVAMAQAKKQVVQSTSFKKNSFNIINYGAKPDGIFFKAAVK